MKRVTFAVAMAPYVRGENRIVPDDVAARLEAEGVLSKVEPWPTQSTPAHPRRTAAAPARPMGPRDGRMAK